MLAAIVSCSGPPAAAQNAKPLRIGVFDSRAVALAYGNSDGGFQQSVRGMRADYDAARPPTTTAVRRNWRWKASGRRSGCTNRGFRLLPVGGILARVKDKLPAIAVTRFQVLFDKIRS